MKYVEVVLVFTVAIMVTSNVATAREFDDQILEQQQQQQSSLLLLPTSNIMLEAFVSEATAGSLTCIGGGGSCINDMSGCCPGNYCNIYFWQGAAHARCEWCPSAGDTCGGLDACCPGYTCDSTWPLNGKCVRV